MNICEIETEWYIIIFSVVIGLLIMVSTPKVSQATLRKIIDDYDAFLDDYNETIIRMNKLFERIKEKFFISTLDADSAFELLQKYNKCYNEMLVYNERLAYYISKNDANKYKRYKKEAEGILVIIQDILNSLECIERNMQTVEECSREECFFEKEYEDDIFTETLTNEDTSDIFFVGCNNAEDLEKRYRALAKVYHPDMPTGDKVTFQKILDEYERRKALS